MRGRIFVLLAAAVLGLALAGPAAGGATRSATVTATFATGTDGHCYPVSVASWTGYQVNRVRHVFYREGHSGEDAAWFTTTGFPRGVSQSSGTMTSMAGVAVVAGEGWYVRALFRSNGGAILAEATSGVAYAPTVCPETVPLPTPQPIG